MKHVKPLLVALLICALVSVVGGVFIQSGMLRALVTGAGVIVAVLSYQWLSRKQ